jgi:D-cysteine desulfhydrase family pyridoxal phosphate-dependent enzyme
MSMGVMFTNLPRLQLAHLPTALEAMPRLSEALGGPRLWIKRDDQTGLATGGNKTRKLEFLMADAVAHEAETVITTGAPQSNHCRQTAAAAARYGLGCVLVLTGDDPGEVSGNILLDHLLGARLVFTAGRVREAVMEEIAESEQAARRTPYLIPVGGSVPLGAAAYALAMTELQTQMEAAGQRFDRIVFASGSGGTQAGLLAGAVLTGFRGQILGISISQEPAKLQSTVAVLATATMDLLGRPRSFRTEDIHLNANFLGEGYAVVGQAEREAIKLYAQNEGVLLDPVYTGRAAAGLIGLIRQGVIGRDEHVLFWHTGGTSGLFAFADELAG